MITNKNVNKKIKLTHKEFIITIIALIILTVLAVFVINRTSIISKTKQAIQKEKKPLFAYEIYNNQDENNIKVLVTVNSEDGIEYIIMPNETRIDCYEKTSTAIDYVAAKNSEGTFKIKEKGKDEKAETIKLDGQTLYSNGIALDETDQSGYKEITTKSNLNTLKDRFTTCSYKIGENGTWTSPSTINSEDKIYKTSALDYDIIQNDLLNEDNTVTIYTKLSDSIGNAVISKSTYSVDTTQNENRVEAESLLKAVEEYDKGNGKYTVTVSDQTYNLKMYTVNGNLTIGANTAIGNNKDVATGEETDKMAKNMVVLKVNGDLTIDENSTLTTFSKEYGGPKGLMIYCTGTITNNGDISQSGKGAYAEGQNVYLLKNTDGNYEYVPATGGSGGNGVYMENGYSNGNSGQNGTNRGTGGGGSGAASGSKGIFYHTGISGSGSSGTSYSGGTGGGGASSPRVHDTVARSGNGNANGGKGRNFSIRGIWCWKS